MKRSAFTLVELLVVISIIGLLSSIAVVSMGSSRDKARIASGQSFEQSLYQKLGDRLEGEWLFDSVSAGITSDSSGMGHTGTIIGASLTQGFAGNALSFDGNDYVDVGAMDIANNITVGAWIRPSTQCQSGFIVGKNPVNSQWELFLEGCYLRWRGGTLINNNASCPEPSINTWHYVVGTQSGTAARVYIDGHLCVTTTIPAIANGGGAVYVGTFGPGAYYFNGLIDEVRVYSGSLIEP